MYYAAVFRGKDILGVQIENIGAASACPCILPERPPPCKDSCKGRYKHAGPEAAVIAALVPLRDYPSGSVPYKEPCRAAAAQEGCRDRQRRRQCFLSAPYFLYNIGSPFYSVVLS